MTYLMNRQTKPRFLVHSVVGGIFVVISMTTEWLLMWPSSPLHQYFLFHVEAPNLWRKIHALPYILAILLGDAHQPSGFGYLTGLTVQWFSLGVIAAYIASKLSRSFSPSDKAT